MRLSVGESRPHKWKLFSQLIMWVEGTDHSHTFISWKDDRIGVRKVAEARGGGGRMVTNHEFKEDNKVVRIYYYEVDEKNMAELEAWLWNHMRPYGFKHVAGLLWSRAGSAIRRLLGKPGTVKNPWKDGDYSQICVELAAKSVERATKQDLPGDIEDYGLIEMQDINKKFSNGQAPQEKIDRINRKKKK